MHGHAARRNVSGLQTVSNVFGVPACGIHPGPCPDHTSGASSDPAAGGPFLAYAAAG